MSGTAQKAYSPDFTFAVRAGEPVGFTLFESFTAKRFEFRYDELANADNGGCSVLIGRAKVCDVVVGRTLRPHVSSRHAVIETDLEDPSHVYLFDYGSTNGTQVAHRDGRPQDVTQDGISLSDGDVIYLPAAAQAEVVLTFNYRYA